MVFCEVALMVHLYAQCHFHILKYIFYFSQEGKVDVAGGEVKEDVV